MKQSKLWKIASIILIIFLLCAGFVFARAGGAGGGRSGGGGGGDGLGGIIIYLFYILLNTLGLVPTLIIVVGIIVVVTVVKRLKARKTALKDLTVRQNPVTKVRGYSKFHERNPSFSSDDFLHKVRTAFIEIQKAWAAKDLSTVRRFISDGVYQRFNTQFQMMNLLQQENPISEVEVNNITIANFRVDGNYDIIHVAVTATMRDQFICKTNPKLNSPGGKETFLEYWSFIRKRGVENKDIYHTYNCPSCGAPLGEDMGELGTCRYCGALVNSGEFDWVLSEITQADDYARGNLIEKAQNLKKVVSSLIDEYEDFAVQLVEDKASNGYLQVKTAEVMKDPAIMRRFVTDDAFERIKANIPDERIVYNRLFLNDVTLVAAQRSHDQNLLTFSVTISYQRVKLSENNRATIIDPYIQNHTQFMQMVRDTAGGRSKGSIYAHTCPSCGASVQDSLDIECAYCGNPLNSTGNEWIVSDILSFEEYRAYLSRESRELELKISSTYIDNLYDVRDYALNNVMIMIGADGVFADEERALAEELARKWKYRPEKIEPLFQLARSGRLAVRMPQDTGKRKKIYELMKKTAEADDRISPEEKVLLDYIKDEYLKDTV
jgi:predicted lipid-binding transport protein (Tim44 family)